MEEEEEEENQQVSTTHVTIFRVVTTRTQIFLISPT